MTITNRLRVGGPATHDEVLMSKNNTPDPLNDAIARYNASLIPTGVKRVRQPYTGRSWPSQGPAPIIMTPAQIDAMPVADGPPERARDLRRQRIMRLAKGNHLVAHRLSQQPEE